MLFELLKHRGLIALTLSRKLHLVFIFELVDQPLFGVLPRLLSILMLFEGGLEGLGLLDAVGVELVLYDLLLQDLVAELELVHAVDEVLLADEQTARLRARAHHRRPPHLRVLHDLLQPENLIQPNQVQ